MNKPYLSQLWLCFLLIVSIDGFAQNTAPSQNIIENTIDSFNAGIGDQSRLYYGIQYSFYEPRIKGNAYNNDNANFEQGAVKYDGYAYKDVPMLYDINMDYAVILLPNKTSMLRLLNERVAYFNIGNHHFININTDTLKTPVNISSGYYEQLYGGKIELLAKNRKIIRETASSSGAITQYFTEQSKNLYLKKDGLYYKAGSQGAFLDVLKDRKNELKQYIKDNKISFKENQEQAMVKVASYYDQITR